MIWSKTVLVRSRLEIFVDSGQNQGLQYFRGWAEKKNRSIRSSYGGVHARFRYWDLEKAFDRVPREVVRWALRKLGVDESGSSAQLWHCIQRLALYLEQMLDSFKVKVGLHQGSVLSPLFFAAVMNVVSSGARSGLLSELLHADELVIMAPTMEQLGRRVTDWRASLLGKGLNVNTGKSKVMVGSSGGKMIVNSGKWPCGFCGKGAQALCSVHSM